MRLKDEFSRFLGADPDRLHFAAHSHHPWPDVSFEAHTQAWTDAANHMDEKWEFIFGEIMPQARDLIASVIGVESGTSIVFAPNTHQFVSRIFSALEPPVRVLSTSSEFHSFERQSRRWEEAGLAIVDRVDTEPFDTFEERFTREVRAGAHDLIFLSEVFYDSGFAIQNIDRIVSSVSEQEAFVVVDGYHSFMAQEVNFGAVQDRAFFVAGGYKYAMAGEGVCFLHSPPGYGPRPVDTGWYAGFGQLESGVSGLIPYADDGSRYGGATFDPSGIYRMRAVQRWLDQQGVTPDDISKHVKELQELFLAEAPDIGELVVTDPKKRGNFLAFEMDEPESLHVRLKDAGVYTDFRKNRLRIGFGIYHEPEDVEELLKRLKEVA